MPVLSSLAGAVAPDTLPIPLAVLAGSDGPNADPAAGADVINTDDEQTGRVAIDETRPNDEESALGSIVVHSPASVVDGTATGSGVGVNQTVNGGNNMNIGPFIVMFLFVVWGVREILKTVGEMVAKIRGVW